MNFKINKKVCLVFVFFFVYFLFLQFTSLNVIGYDGYSHMKTAELIKERGFFDEFEWLPMSSIGERYADIQVLFHLLLIPFSFFIYGGKIFVVLFSALFFSVFYWFLVRSNVKYSFFYTLVFLFGSSELVYRFLLTRPMVLSLICLLLVLFFTEKKMYKSLGVVFFVYSLLYSGFIFGIGIVFVYYVIGLFFGKFDHKIIVYPLAGVLAGLLINPYFPANIGFLFTQWFKVNLIGNLYNQEWRAWGFYELLRHNWLFFILFFSSVFFTIKNKMFNRKVFFYFAISLFFLIGMVGSRRMHEYFVPFSILFFVFVFDGFFVSFFKNFEYGRYLKYGLVVFLLILAIVNSFAVRTDVLNNDFLYKFEGCADWMNKNIEKGSLVFNNGYTFNYLFYNTDLRYTHGIDLTYSYLYDEEMFERYMDVLQGKSVSGNIVKDYNADYVFLGKIKQDVKLFEYINKNSGNFELGYEDKHCTVLKVVE